MALGIPIRLVSIIAGECNFVHALLSLPRGLLNRAVVPSTVEDS